MPSRDKLSEFAAWCQSHITGDEKGQAQIFLDRLFQACGQPGCLDVGGTTEFRVRKSGEDGGGTAFADYVWKPVVLVKRGVPQPMAQRFTLQMLVLHRRCILRGNPCCTAG